MMNPIFKGFCRGAGCLLIVVSAITGAAVDAHADGLADTSSVSLSAELRCLQASPLNTLAECIQVGINADPTSVSVNEVSLTLQYDPSIYTFDPADSGPLGIYSIGGDAPPVDPGIGTQPIQLQPSTGDQPGAPLPGSTLTYTNVNGLLTIDYVLANPITQTSDLNFFLIEFSFVNPVFIDLSKSTATYATSGPGTDFSATNFTCTTTDPNGGCGSDNPSTGISLQLASVPEPSTLFMLGPGLALWGIARARQDRNRV